MNEIFTVSELTQAIKKQLEGRFPSLSVRGEISNLKEQSSGHFYFTLKDQEAQISAVLFRGNASALQRPPRSGDQVIVRGELSVYAPRGNYQIIIRELQYAGVGELLQKLHELKLKLQQMGWFDPLLKKSLPKLPRRIGVVTSPTGAVIQDILHILERRFSGFHLILNPVKVQGEGAAQEIAKAIEDFNRYKLADVLIVGRGGGSLEDLWPFNEEIVARAIRESKIPIISAVGHETDFSISDFVADVRAPTPSAAAQIVILDKNEQLNHLQQLKHRLAQSMRSILDLFCQKMDGVCEELDNRMQVALHQKKLRLLALEKQASALKPSAQIAALRQKLLFWNKNLLQHMQQMRQQKQERLERLVDHLRAIDPRNLLTKGYCLLFSEKKDSVILSAKTTEVGEKLKIQLHDGLIHSTIDNIEVKQ